MTLPRILMTSLTFVTNITVTSLNLKRAVTSLPCRPYSVARGRRRQTCSARPKDHSARCLTACDSMLSLSHFTGRYRGNLLHSWSMGDCG